MTEPSGPMKVGRYEIRRVLGRGGNGIVLGAYDTELGREVAVKFHSAPPADATGTPDRLQAEARALAAVADPSVVPVLNIEEYDTRSDDPAIAELVGRYGLPPRGQYIVLEWVHGQTLQAAWQEAVPLAQRLGHVAQLAAALESLHRAGFVHRDVKPANAMLESSGRVRLLDLGIARNVSEVESTRRSAPDRAEVTTLTDPGDRAYIIGTPSYMAPEQLLGNSVDARADQYGLAACLFYAAFGREPEARVASDSDAMVAIPSRLASGEATPAALAVLLRRGLAADPSDRFESVQAFAEALRDVRPRRRRRWLVAAGGLVAMAAATVVIGVRTGPAPERLAVGDGWPALRAEVDLDTRPLEDELQRARTLRLQTKLDEALEIVAGVEQQAHALGSEQMVAEALLARGAVYDAQLKMAEARAVYDEAFEIGQRASLPWIVASVAARASSFAGVGADGVAEANKRVGFAKAALREMDTKGYEWGLLAYSEASTKARAGEVDEALKLVDGGLARLSDPSPRRLQIEATLRILGANCALMKDDNAAAAAYLEPAHAIIARIGTDSPQTALNVLLVAGLLEERGGNPAGAMARYEHASAIAQEALPPGHPTGLQLALNTSAVALSMGRHAEAEKTCRAALAEADPATAPPGFYTGLLQCVGMARLRQGDSSGALKRLQEARTIVEVSLGDPSDALCRLLSNLAAIQSHVEDFEAAERNFKKAIADTKKLHGDDNYLLGDLYYDYGSMLAKWRGDLVAARSMWSRTIDILEPKRGPEAPRVVHARDFLANYKTVADLPASAKDWPSF